MTGMDNKKLSKGYCMVQWPKVQLHVKDVLKTNLKTTFNLQTVNAGNCNIDDWNNCYDLDKNIFQKGFPGQIYYEHLKKAWMRILTN